MPMTRVPDPEPTSYDMDTGWPDETIVPEPDFNSPGWHEDEFGSDLTPYPDDAAIQGAPDFGMLPDHEDEEGF